MVIIRDQAHMNSDSGLIIDHVLGSMEILFLTNMALTC